MLYVGCNLTGNKQRKKPKNFPHLHAPNFYISLYDCYFDVYAKQNKSMKGNTANEHKELYVIVIASLASFMGVCTFNFKLSNIQFGNEIEQYESFCLFVLITNNERKTIHSSQKN